MRTLAVVIALSGCGRVGFDAHPDGGAAPTDATVATDAADAPVAIAPIHRYQFAGDLHDDLGGADLLPGVLGTFGAGGYSFAACGGLELANAPPPDGYTIDLEFSFATLTSWRKIVDYDGLVADTGLYTYGNALQFVIVPAVTFATSATPDFLPDAVHRMTLTRDAAGQTVGYVDGAMVIGFVDDLNVAQVTAANTLWFFDDDSATAAMECSAGTVRRIEIFDVALSATQVAQL